MRTDLLSNPLTTDENDLLTAYELVRNLASRELSPAMLSNVRAALAPLAIAVIDHGLDFEHLTDYGC